MRQHIARIALVVRDYDEAIAFYTQKLKFQLLEDTRLSETKRWVVVALSSKFARLSRVFGLGSVSSATSAFLLESSTRILLFRTVSSEVSLFATVVATRLI